MKNPLRELLNKIIWDPRVNPEIFEICFISRGFPGDVERVRCNNLVKVTRDYFYIEENNRVKKIPLHRVIYVKDLRKNVVVYSKSGRRG
ncbi:MAG: DUF504 domain-containing protein [Thermoproteales archaeon]|nr:DUF504 domain-containing protein [Thermoproteales archaeon]RLE67282.1 MAG: hypothetical protein DRJ47_00220 [Thermoprotei archaeon]